MLSNAFSKSIKLTYRGAFHSLLCSRICFRVKMWSEHESPGRKPVCSCLMYSSSASNSLVWMILLRTLLVMGSRATPLRLSQSPKSPFLGNSFQELFHSPISLWVCTVNDAVFQCLQPLAFLLSLHLLHMPFPSSSLWWQILPLLW